MKVKYQYKPKHYKGIKILMDYHIKEYKTSNDTMVRKYAKDTVEFLAREQREQSYDDTTRDMLNKLRSMYTDEKNKEKRDFLDDITWGT